MNLFEPHISGRARKKDVRFRVFFIPGYRTKSVENYHAQNAVVEACKGMSEFTCDTLAYPQEKIGRHNALPSFSEMTRIAKSAYLDDTPTIIVGHCTGAAVAVALAQTVSHAPPAGILLLCPPVSLHEANLERTRAFRIFGISTHIPKAPFVSEDYKKVLSGKATATWEAMSIFQRLSSESLAPMPLSQLIFLSASEDTECSSTATERLANVLGCPHHQVNDNHSLKYELTTHTIKSLIINIKGNYDDLSLQSEATLSPLFSTSAQSPCTHIKRPNLEAKTL